MTVRPFRARLGALASLLASTVALPAAAQEATTLNFLTAEQDATVMPMIEGFEALHPEIDVVHESIPFDAMNAAIESRIGAQDPSIDVFLADSPRIPALASRGYLASMEDLRADVEAVASPAAVEVLSWNGELFALPFWTSTQLMFYNKGLLDAAGIPYPSASPDERLTYEQVVDLAKQAQAAGAEFGFFPEQIDRYYQLQPMFESAGAGPGLTGEGNLTPDITSDAWVEAAEFYARLFEEGVAPRGIAVDQMQSVFTSGDVAFYIGGPWNLSAFDAAEGLSYGVAPVPYFEGGTPATPTDSWAVAVSPYAAHPEEARLFAEYVSLNPEGATLSVQPNPIPPVNSEAYASYIERIAGMNPEVGEDVRAIMTHELANTTVSRPRSVGYVAFEEVMNRAFSDIRNGAEVRPTLEQASQQLESTLARIQ
jgi:multiple sugar transport system substrate-binding protein